MRRRIYNITNLPDNPETNEPVDFDYVYYPLNGDLNDYSGNNMHITYYSGVTISSDHIYSQQTGYCELPFYLGSSINTTVSVSFYYSGKGSIIRNLWGRVSDTSSLWTEYCNIIRLLSTSSSSIISCSTDGEVIGSNTDTPLITGEVNNITLVKTLDFVYYYINGNLYRTNSVVADNYAMGESYKPYLGNRNNKGSLISSEGGDVSIYGFAYFRRALSESEVKNWVNALNSGTLI